MSSLRQSDIEIVRRDWRKVERIAEVAGRLFYDRLFVLDPGLRALFKTDIAEQSLKLVRMISAAVDGLEDPELLLPIVRYLGRKHARLGVRDEHYEPVGSALLWTLRQGLGAEFGAESEAAWTRVYGLLADTMKGRS